MQPAVIGHGRVECSPCVRGRRESQQRGSEALLHVRAEATVLQARRFRRSRAHETLASARSRGDPTEPAAELFGGGGEEGGGKRGTGRVLCSGGSDHGDCVFSDVPEEGLGCDLRVLSEHVEGSAEEPSACAVVLFEERRAIHDVMREEIK